MTWKPPKEQLELFRLFTPGVPYPGRDIRYTVMSLSSQMIASSPVGSLRPDISFSVSSVLSIIPPLRAQPDQGGF